MSKKATWISVPCSERPSQRKGDRNCGRTATVAPAGGASICFQIASARACTSAQKAMYAQSSPAPAAAMRAAGSRKTSERIRLTSTIPVKKGSRMKTQSSE